MTYNDLIECARSKNIPVVPFSLSRVPSLSFLDLADGSCAVAIDNSKIKSPVDSLLCLSHELGHCLTGAFYSEYALPTWRAHCEEEATGWEIEHILPLEDILAACRSGLNESWQLSEHFNLPQSFIEKAVDYYGMRW